MTTPQTSKRVGLLVVDETMKVHAADHPGRLVGRPGHGAPRAGGHPVPGPHHLEVVPPRVQDRPQIQDFLMQTLTRFRVVGFSVLKRLSCLFKLLPKPLFSLLWRGTDIFEGNLGSAIRYTLIASRLKQCGTNVYFGPFLTIVDSANLILGDDVSIHHNTTLIASGGISIGHSVSIAHGCSLVSSNHTWHDNQAPIKRNPVRLARINIENDCWIGCGARILAGTHIHQRVVVAAGAVVTRTIQARQVVGGVPAATIKYI